MSCHKSTLEGLQKQGVRLTAQRALILEDMFHHPGHRTAGDVYERVSQRLPGLNRATVYRTLELLHGVGVVAAFPGPQGVVEFELLRSDDDVHHHLVCRRCGAEVALERGPVDRLKAEICQRHGFQADLDHLVFSGLCAQCQVESKV